MLEEKEVLKLLKKVLQEYIYCLVIFFYLGTNSNTHL